jgi:hypothetical protein
MNTIIAVLLFIDMLAVLGVLVAGMVGVATNTDPHRSNRLMQWRVGLQGTAILLFVLLMLTR